MHLNEKDQLVSETSRKDRNISVHQIVKDRLESMGFFVSDGIKYGLDFLVYTDSPMKVHSKYAVLVDSSCISCQQIILAQRVCNSNKKRLIIARFTDDELEFIEIKRFTGVN